MATWFISDLHLQPERADLVQALYCWVDDTLNAQDTLYILGDFFDAWIGDDEDGAFYEEIRAKLAVWVARGIAVFFMHGNRDFLVGRKFAQDTGVKLVQEPELIELGGKKILLMHGDSLCTRDTGYMEFRNTVRSSAWQQQFLSQPLNQRRAIARDLRERSKSMNSSKAEDIMDVTPAEVKNVILETGADILLHGHTHRPGRHKLERGASERIVLGDWNTKAWYVVANEDKIELASFDIDQHQVSPSELT